MQDLSSLLSFAHELADAAASKTVPLFRSGTSVENKLDSGFDPVTLADREAELVMRKLIETNYPDHAIIGEEFGVKQGGSLHALQWVLDPIDGTRAFITGMPSWGTLIALNDGGQVVLGILDQPFTGERFSASRSGETILQHKTTKRVLKTRKCDSLPEAVLATTSHAFFINAPGEQAFADIVKTAKMTRYGGDCYNYAMVAAGQIDAVIEQGLKAYDIQALIPIVEGAGGIVTNWKGEDAAQGGQVIASGDPTLHEILIARLSSEAA